MVNRNRLSGLPDQPASHSFTPVTLYDGFNYNLSSDHINTVVAAPENSVLSGKKKKKRIQLMISISLTLF
ncbi:hypothetical protein AtNW77_Chr2g0258941 [Arabidopsis thaliana]